MMITNTTTVTFKMPEEHKQEQLFRLHHNMDEWTEVNDSGYVSYKKADLYGDLMGKAERRTDEQV